MAVARGKTLSSNTNVVTVTSQCLKQDNHSSLTDLVLFNHAMCDWGFVERIIHTRWHSDRYEQTDLRLKGDIPYTLNPKPFTFLLPASNPDYYM